MDVDTREVWPRHPDMANQEGWFGAWSQSWSPDGSFVTLTREATSREEQTTWSGVTYDAVTNLSR